MLLTFIKIKQLILTLDGTLKTKDAERKAYKEKYGIMTQEERENMMKSAAKSSS